MLIILHRKIAGNNLPNKIRALNMLSPLLQVDYFSVRVVVIPEPEKAQKTADLSFVFFVVYGLDCKQLDLCELCLFEWSSVIFGIFYIVCKIATTCCDEWKSNEQAAIETVFFHESAF